MSERPCLGKSSERVNATPGSRNLSKSTPTTNNHSLPSARQHNLSTFHHQHDFSSQQLVIFTGFGTHTTVCATVFRSHKRRNLQISHSSFTLLSLSSAALLLVLVSHLPSITLSPLSGSRGFLSRLRNHLEFHFFAFAWAVWIAVRESKRRGLGITSPHHQIYTHHPFVGRHL